VIIAPLKKIPDFFKSYDCYPEVFYSLPVVQKGKEIFAYPYTKTNAELQYIVNCTIKENLISLAR
ncbi:MAG: tRNA(Ile)-lysidine synthetase, partial [Wolbachia endosymbiont of Tyrophagus putrescentiae]|nr:tRNA(Ile)-lysidine synthetase [Wolbachia endosymbiont of Tyrophagus putrescentiae]